VELVALHVILLLFQEQVLLLLIIIVIKLSVIKEAGLSDKVSFYQSDFMKLQDLPRDFDAAYSIEATCHAPDKEGLYQGIFHQLKAGVY